MVVKQSKKGIMKMLHSAISWISITEKIISTNNEEAHMDVFLCLFQMWKRNSQHSIPFQFRNVIGFIIPCQFVTHVANTTSEISNSVVSKETPVPDSFSELPSKLQIQYTCCLLFNIKKIQALLKPLAGRQLSHANLFLNCPVAVNSTVQSYITDKSA